MESENIHWSNYDIAELYMIMGGIPFYLSQIDPSISLSENIDQIFFKEHGLLWDEFYRLYDTLFNGNQKYIKIVEILSEIKYGLTRNEIANKLKIPANGALTKMLQNLIDSGFVFSIVSYRASKDTVYLLRDFYTLFYFRFLKGNKGKDEHYWSNSFDLPKRRGWLSLSFELLCLGHVNEIKKALGISGVNSTYYSWNKKGDDGAKGAQIDLAIDRRDNVASLCEMKFTMNEFEINKDIYMELMNKIVVFQSENKRKSVQTVLITTYGLKRNQYSNAINKCVTLDAFFAK